MRRDAARMLLLGGFVLVLACSRRWAEADAFRSSLKCGTTRAEAEQLAVPYGAQVSEAPAPQAGEQIVTVRKGRTAFWLYFREGRLEKVRRGEYAPACRLDPGQTEHLCSG
jgi:hypothetical protein